MLRHLCLFALLLWLVPASASALDPTRRLSQYAHAAWRARDGFFVGTPTALAQTADGYIWVGTSAGLLRFDGVRFVPWSPGGGQLPAAYVTSLLPGRDGSLWIATLGGLSRWKDETLTTYQGWVSGASSILEDRHGKIWFTSTEPSAGGRSFCQVLDPAPRCYGNADGIATFRMVTGITEDAAHNVWIAVGGTPRKLMRIEGLAVREEYHDGALPRRVAADPTGGVWVGLLNGDLAHYANGKLQTFPFDHADAARLHQIEAGSDGSVLAATSFGLIGWSNGTRLTLTRKNGLPCDAVTAMTFDAQQDLWLFTECGLARVPAGDLQRWKRDPETRVSGETLDVFDGVQTGQSPFVGGATTRDGRLWFANTTSLLMVDPAALRRNPLPPPVHVARVIADRKSYPAYEAIRNACTHSGATRLAVELSYGRDLAVRVADNGIGIDSPVVDRGKQGHFGLQGMRERAARIGATLTIVSEPGTGTEIVVTTPGRVVFRKT